VPSRAALGRSLRRLTAKAVADERGGGSPRQLKRSTSTIPDGLGIEIYRDRPRDSWRSATAELAMATDPLDLQSLYEEPGAETSWDGLEAGTIMGHVHLHVPHPRHCRVGFSATGLVSIRCVRRYPGALFVSAGGYHIISVSIRGRVSARRRLRKMPSVFARSRLNPRV
jgi:catechol 2,3-dioxygenase